MAISLFQLTFGLVALSYGLWNLGALCGLLPPLFGHLGLEFAHGVVSTLFGVHSLTRATIEHAADQLECPVDKWMQFPQSQLNSEEDYGVLVSFSMSAIHWWLIRVESSGHKFMCEVDIEYRVAGETRHKLLKKRLPQRRDHGIGFTLEQCEAVLVRVRATPEGKGADNLPDILVTCSVGRLIFPRWMRFCCDNPILGRDTQATEQSIGPATSDGKTGTCDAPEADRL